MRIRARLTQQHFPTQEREKEPLKDHSERELFPLRVVSLGDSLTAGTQEPATLVIEITTVTNGVFPSVAFVPVSH